MDVAVEAVEVGDSGKISVGQKNVKEKVAGRARSSGSDPSEQAVVLCLSQEAAVFVRICR